MKPSSIATFRPAYVLPIAMLALLGAGAVMGQEADRREDPAWTKIASHFQPPAELAGDLGDYRSPLLFDDGRPVQTPEQWNQRRQEILRFWHHALGPCPLCQHV